jgi:hypothetical protein
MHMLSIPMLRSALVGAAATGVLLASAAPALAGPPLICHPVDIGTARSLPWGQGTGWDAAVKSYDVTRLTDETLRLLTPEAAIPLRRETLRRAAIYAARDPRAAGALLTAVVGRVLNAEATGRSDAMAWFDAGYLVETYRQASLVYRWDMLSGRDREAWTMKDEPRGFDGFAWMQRAFTLSNQNPAIAQAMSLMRETAPRSAQR